MKGRCAYAESVCATEELKFYKDNVDPADMTSLKKPTTEHEPVMKFKSADDTKLVDFVPGDSSKQFSISANLDPKSESALIEFIHENRDIFAWKPSDMPGVPRELAEHSHNIDPKFKPVRQFLRRFNEERRKAIGEEVTRLLAAGFIVEVFHPEWLANPVLVLKKERHLAYVCGLHGLKQGVSD